MAVAAATSSGREPSCQSNSVATSPALGKAYWLDADKAGTQHGDMNRGKEPMEVIVVELKNDKPKI